MTSATKLVFCFPYHGVGGVSLLFLRVAEELVNKAGVDAYLVDYADGFMARHRQEGLTHLIEYRDDEPVAIPEDTVVVFQSMTPWSIYPSLQIPPGARILFWNCHPFNLVPTLPGFRRQMQRDLDCGRFVLSTILRGYRNKMVRLIRLMLDKHSLVFMDTGNVTATERYLGIAIPDPEFLPIPVEAPSQRKIIEGLDFQSNGLRVAWIGRIVDFKYYILKYVLVELDKIQPEAGLPISFTIVGSGDFDELLRADVSKLCNLSVRFIEYIAPDELDDFLCKEIDMMMAMGTSALAGAKLGIPAILLDVCYGEVPNGYVFRWLHERSGYSLGEVIDAAHVVAGNRSLRECIHQTTTEYSYLSDLTFSYFEKYHALNRVAERLLHLAENAKCTYGDLSKAHMVGRGKIYACFNSLRKRLA